MLDFGLAMQLDATMQFQRAIAGTMDYMAPEIFYDTPPSVASDLYSVGVIAYRIFTGHPPFDSAKMRERLSSVLEQIMYQPPDLRGAAAPHAGSNRAIVG